jgi:hypothetical protein
VGEDDRVTAPEDPEKMSVTVEVALTDVQRERLRGLARQISLPDTGAPNAEVLLSGLASAAVAEYLAHATLQPPITTVSALRELRLAVLSEHLLGGSLPSEGFVADLFALTATEARSLLRRSVARQPARLHQAIRTAARRSVEEAQGIGRRPTKFVMTADPAVVTLLLTVLERSGESPPPFTAREDAIGKYDLPKATRDVLIAELTDAPAKSPARTPASKRQSAAPPSGGRRRRT